MTSTGRVVFSRRTMLARAGLALGATALGGLLQACANQGSPAPSGGSAAAPAAASSSTSAPATVAAPTVASAASGATDWQTVIDAAKKEGTVVVYGSPGDALQTAFTQGFQDKYGIPVDFSGSSGGEMTAKILTARAAGAYNVDVANAGAQSFLHDLRPANALTSVTPLLVGPNDSDPSVWSGGSYIFTDDAGDDNMLFCWRVQVPFIYNTNLVNPTEITSWRDLLDPKWTGKIAMLDPTHAGGSQEIITFLYSTMDDAKGFLGSLFKQNVLILTDNKQILDLVGHGEQAVAIGPDVVQAYALKNQGTPIDLFPGQSLKEGSFVSASEGTLGALDRPPHPNAQKLYLDWLLSQEGQLTWSKASGLASARTDVPTDFLLPAVVPQPGVTYTNFYKEHFQLMTDEVEAYLKTVMPS